MRTVCLIALAMCLMLATWQVALAQDGQPTVTLDVAGQAAADMAAELTRQTGVQIGVVSPCTAVATVKVTDAKTEDAVKAFAEAIEASWIRVYVLESATPETPWTADQLYAGISNQRQIWFDSFTDEQRQALFEKWQAAGAFGRGFGGRGGQGGQGGPPPAAGEAPAATPQPPPDMPGAGRSNLQRRLREEAQAAGGQQPAGGQGGPGGPGGRGMQYADPVRDLIIPLRTETVTLNLTNATLQQALFDLTTVSGFIVAAGNDLDGIVNLQAENKPIEEVVSQIAQAVNAQWRPLYLLSVPREITQAEMEQRMEQGFQNRWAQYWAKSPEERAKDIQQGVERITEWGERAQGGDERAARGLQRFGTRMLSRLSTYAAGLTPEQRMELKPLIKALGQAIGQPPQ